MSRASPPSVPIGLLGDRGGDLRQSGRVRSGEPVADPDLAVIDPLNEAVGDQAVELRVVAVGAAPRDTEAEGKWMSGWRIAAATTNTWR